MADRELALAHWRRAKIEVAASDALLQLDFRVQTVSRSYYAMMHAANAALQLLGITTGSHSGVRSQFGRHLVRTGAIEKKWASLLSEQYMQRWNANYDIHSDFSRSQADYLNRRGHRFVARMQQYLLSQNLTEQQLDAM